jgi:hypothetical protein
MDQTSPILNFLSQPDLHETRLRQHFGDRVRLMTFPITAVSSPAQIEVVYVKRFLEVGVVGQQAIFQHRPRRAHLAHH